MSESPETVVLLADDGAVIGTAPKATVHTTQTPLPLGKKTWPGVWTNAFCGHPAPGEDPIQAITRRAERELGLTITDLRVALPDFRYRAVDASGIVENEICPVYTARAVGDLSPADDEVAEWAWVDPDQLRSAVAGAPFAFSPWLGWQLAAWEGDYSAPA